MRIHDLRYRTWLQMRLLSVVWKVFLVLPRKIPTRYITNFITYTKTTFKSTFNLTECTYICISHFLNAKMTEQFTGTFPPILHQYWKLSPLSLHHRNGALTPVLQYNNVTNLGDLTSKIHFLTAKSTITFQTQTPWNFETIDYSSWPRVKRSSQKKADRVRGIQGR